MTTLSVVLCAYNEQDRLPTALAALATQTRQPDEYVLLDDGSTDGTRALLAAVAHPHVRRVSLPGPSGPPRAYNVAVGHTTGEWLYLTSGNDVVQPGAFAVWARAVRRAGQDTRLLVGETDEAPLGWSPHMHYVSPRALQRRLTGGGQIHGAGVFIRREVWQQAGGYDPALEWLADWWLYHSLALRYGCVYLPRQIATLARLEGQFSYGFRDRARMARVAERLLWHLAQPANADVRARLHATPLLDYPHTGSGRARAAQAVGA